MALKRRWIAALLGAAGIAVSASSAAQATRGAESGFYVGGSLGQSEVDDFCSIFGPGISCDEKDSAWKFFGGYQVNRNFALELGYTNLGEVSARDNTGTLRLESTAWEVVGIGSIPIDRFSLYGKLGVYRADTELRFRGSGLSESDDESTTDLTFGFGVRYDFTRNLAVRAEWQKYSDVEAAGLGEGDVDVMSVGVLWRF